MSSVEQSINKLLTQQVLKAAQVIEDKIDEEINQLDELKLDDIESLRERRLQEMKKQQKLKQEYRAKGHGEYSELKDQAEFFKVTKTSPNIVVHFYKPSTERCKIVDHHLSILAKNHLEAKFCKIQAESSMFLAERMNIRMIPTIVLIKDGIMKDRIVGFADLGNCDDFSTEMLEWRIATIGVIEYDGDLLQPPEKTRAAKTKPVKPRTIRDHNSSDSDDEF